MSSSLTAFLDVPLLIAVVVLMVYRRLYKEFSFFFVYLLVVLAGDIVRRLFVYGLYKKYFYAYWITEGINVLLGFFVLYEVFLIATFPRFRVILVYRRLFPVIGILVLALTVWMFLGAPAKGPHELVVLIGRFTLALNFCQVAVMMFFGVLILYMSREWRRYEMGIATGFGVNAAVKLLVTALRANSYYSSTKIDQLPTISYLVAIAIWLFYLSKRDPEPERVEMTEELVHEVDRVCGELVRALGRRRKRQ